MFITDLVDEIHKGSAENLQTMKSWRRFDTADVYFQLTERQVIGGEIEEVVVFISDPYELRRAIELSRAFGHGGTQRVKVCTPGKVNGTDRWSQDILHALYFGVHRIKKTVKPIYITSGGTLGLKPNENLKMFAKMIIYQELDFAIDLFDDFIPLHLPQECL